ncbi:MAG: copper resistance protein CopC [Chloroflexi bacterium]|nr:copper resistance protein CopC [Chloroflexota bacterium]
MASPVEVLQLHFSPAARLGEVIVSGPEGVMPTMIHASGEVADYSIPLSGLGPGAYLVSWRATSSGREHRGSIAFTVK